MDNEAFIPPLLTKPPLKPRPLPLPLPKGRTEIVDEWLSCLAIPMPGQLLWPKAECQGMAYRKSLLCLHVHHPEMSTLLSWPHPLLGKDYKGWQAIKAISTPKQSTRESITYWLP